VCVYVCLRVCACVCMCVRVCVIYVRVFQRESLRECACVTHTENVTSQDDWPRIHSAIYSLTRLIKTARSEVRYQQTRGAHYGFGGASREF